MKSLHTVIAVVEAVAGLLCYFSHLQALRFCLERRWITGSATNLARVGGAAVLGLAIVCWLARRDAYSLTSQGLPARTSAGLASMSRGIGSMFCIHTCCNHERSDETAT
jgi:hypothetical protein